MKKLMLATCLIGMYSSAQAAPNIWMESFGQGFNIFSIQDSRGQTLTVSCNSGAGEDYDHSAYFETHNKKNYENRDHKFPLSFIIDGVAVSPSTNTTTRNGANDWGQFTQAISKGKKIEVFINNRKMTTFTPAKSSMKIAKVINSSTCQAQFYNS